MDPTVMKYRLLRNNIGIIATREPELVAGTLRVSFADVPDGMTAIFEREDGQNVYRALSDGACGVESVWLRGSIKVTVALLIGSMGAERWPCEGFYAKPQDGGSVLIYPDDMDVREQIVRLQEWQSTLKKEMEKLEEKQAELETRFEKMLEGYDIV